MTADPFQILQQRYRSRAADHAGLLEKALAKDDGLAVSIIAHKLHGGGAIFGFPQITIFAEPLEAAAEGGVSGDALRALAEPLLAELARIAQAA